MNGNSIQRPPNRLRAAPRYEAATLLSSRGLIHTPETEVRYYGGQTAAGVRDLDRQAQAKSLRLRMYVLCSECARPIDLAEGNRPQRDVEGADFVRHATEGHAVWLEVLDLPA